MLFVCNVLISLSNFLESLRLYPILGEFGGRCEAPKSQVDFLTSLLFGDSSLKAMLVSLLALPVLSILAQAQSIPSLSAHSLLKDVPALPLGLYRHLKTAEDAVLALQKLDYTSSHSDQLPFLSSSSSSSFPPHQFNQCVSHDPDVPSNSTFQQRYWFDASHYKEGGPVFLLDAGETNGEGRIPFLEKGILRILSQATGGIGIVFEHRYCE